MPLADTNEGTTLEHVRYVSGRLLLSVIVSLLGITMNRKSSVRKNSQSVSWSLTVDTSPSGGLKSGMGHLPTFGDLGVPIG